MSPEVLTAEAVSDGFRVHGADGHMVCHVLTKRPEGYNEDHTTHWVPLDKSEWQIRWTGRVNATVGLHEAVVAAIPQ